MGICYAHLFVVADTSWRPTRERAEAIHRELHRWGLAGKSPGGKPTLYSIDRGQAQPVAGGTIADAELPPELLMRYAGADDAGACERIFGPDSTFTCGADVWLGMGPKIVECGYAGLRVEVVAPPRDRKGRARPEHALEPGLFVRRMYDWSDGDQDLACVIHGHDPRTGRPDRPPPPGYAGWFRSGVLVDCDESLPAFCERSEWAVPNREFVGALSNAFGGPLAELGIFW